MQCRACTGTGSLLVDLQYLAQKMKEEVEELAFRVQDISARETRALKLIVEKMWQEKGEEVLRLEGEHQILAKEITEKTSMVERITLAKVGDKAALEEKVKEENRAQGRRAGRRAGKCKPLDSWVCNHCILSAYDSDIGWRECSECGRNLHITCKLLSECDVDTPVQCRECSSSDSYKSIEKEVSNGIKKLVDRSRELDLTLTRAKADQADLQTKAQQFVGEIKREFRMRTDQIGATKAEYHSHCFVGNHVDKIFKHFEFLIEPLESSRPDLSTGLMEWVESLRY